MIRLGVTGTDTGVGKTVVAAALAAMLRRRGLAVAALKPVESGVAADDPASDAALLRAAAGADDPLDAVRPLRLDEPLAPWIAARRAGRTVDVEALDDAVERLAEGRGAVLVEGAGGIRVPVTRDLAWDGLFVRWGLDVVVVAANRLGVLSHTLLTAEAARHAGLRVRGVVLNPVSGDAGGVAEATNADALRELLAPTPVLPFPWLGGRARDVDALADAAEAAGLDVLAGEISGPR